ncbi:hypothetical protein PIIN_08421 [Serendipita indica DSM 11827]|uniref:Uncharacterized protein n=1 Tax=Serendipita indica (strain DSM 11827) TaxID=1109443 RepID=G4TT25_SERID|nr:hypothetical protein PIIN_08421 [Serendipita indica DSM 11827]
MAPIVSSRSYDSIIGEISMGQVPLTRMDDYTLPKGPPSLPFELWVRILFYFGLACLETYDLGNLDTLPTQMRLADLKTGSPQLQRWKDLQRVCRIWHQILEASPILVFDGNKSVSTTPTQLVSRVHVELISTFGLRYYDLYPDIEGPTFWEALPKVVPRPPSRRYWTVVDGSPMFRQHLTLTLDPSIGDRVAFPLTYKVLRHGKGFGSRGNALNTALRVHCYPERHTPKDIRRPTVYGLWS